MPNEIHNQFRRLSIKTKSYELYTSKLQISRSHSASSLNCDNDNVWYVRFFFYLKKLYVIVDVLTIIVLVKFTQGIIWRNNQRTIITVVKLWANMILKKKELVTFKITYIQQKGSLKFLYINDHRQHTRKKKHFSIEPSGNCSDRQNHIF